MLGLGDFGLDRLAFLPFEQALDLGKLGFQLGYLDLLNLLGDPCPPAKLSHQVFHCSELCHVNVQGRLRRDLSLPDQTIQKCFGLLNDAPKQTRKPAVDPNGLHGLFVDLLLLRLQNFLFRDTHYQGHVRCSVPVLAGLVVRPNLFRSGIVLADFLVGEIDAVGVEYLQPLSRVLDVAVDEGGVEPFRIFQEEVALEGFLFRGE